MAALGLSVLLGVAAGCGGSSKKGDTTPGADNNDPLSAVVGGDRPERDISKDARADYKAALAYFQEQDTNGWSRDSCESAADKFEDVAGDHEKLVEAPYMAGVSYDKCGMSDKAEGAYKQALAVEPGHARSLSNLGSLYFAAGERDKAKEHWEKAVELDGKVVAARNNLAWLLLQDLRVTSDRSAWKKIEEQAAKQLSSALAVNNEMVEIYVLYGLLYLEGSDRNRNRLDLANLLLEEGKKRDDKYAPLYNARGLLQMRRNNLGEALVNFQRAVELDSSFTEARMNVGNITLGFRKYDEAMVHFQEVLKIQPDNYDAHVGLGIAQRGLGQLDAAQASYEKAISIDDSKGDAYFNLGVLFKDFRANNVSDLSESKQAYERARDYFNGFLDKSNVEQADKKEAQDNIADCEKIIKQLDEIIKANAASS
ncbi:MAG: hypothetical protein Tsb0020_40500 [Haliangiales bacterium]